MRSWWINTAIAAVGLGLSIWLRRRQRINEDASYRQQLAAWQAKPPQIPPMKTATRKEA